MSKRFTTDNGSHEDVTLVDNLTKKEYTDNFDDVVELCNNLWNQTQRFEKHNQELIERNTRQANTIAELSEKVDNFIDFKGRLDGKIQEYTTKSEEYELSACGCGARINAYKKQALEELKEELFK